MLIATDILAEGLNLQDATCIINYDLRWNPVRLMQRIGRVDRRLDRADVQKRRSSLIILKWRRFAGTVWLWNFLPPNELNQILSLYEQVTHKTLRISKTFGIEGRKLLTPDDDYNALREFNQAYEGTTTSTEEMFLAYQRLLIAITPICRSGLKHMPLRVFSGREHPIEGTRGVFFCYRLPAKDTATGEWDRRCQLHQSGILYNLEDGNIEEDATRIFSIIQSTPDTARVTSGQKSSLSELRRKMDKHISNTYLKKVQAPAGVTPTLLAWMELV